MMCFDTSVLSSQCNGVSISTLSSQSTKKRKKSENLALSTEEPRHKKHLPLDRSFRNIDGPRVGRHPVFDVSIRLLHLNRVVRTKALMDTGATTFCLSDRFVKMYSVPQVQRDFPQQLKDVAGRHLAWGEAFTEPLTFRLSNRAFRERMEIIPMEPGHSIIIPEWWREELGVTWRSDSTLPGGYEVSFGSTPKELQKPSQLESDGINGAHIDDDAEDSFNIEWDDSLLSGDELPGQIGSILTTDGVPKMLPNGTWVPTSSLRVSISSVGPTDKEMLLRLPKRYHPFLKLFSRTTAQKLPEHSVYDHTIPLIPGTSPPWGPIYPMSQAELDTLREYLDDMLKSGKIRPSQSPAGAPILFVPKPHGRGLRLCVE